MKLIKYFSIIPKTFLILLSLVLFSVNSNKTINAQSCAGDQCPINYCGVFVGTTGGQFKEEECSLTCGPPYCDTDDGKKCDENDPYEPDQTSVCFEDGGDSGCINGQTCVRNCPDDLENYDGPPGCFTTDNVTMWCCDTPDPTPTPTPTPTPPGGGEGGGGGGGGGGDPTPTPTPTQYFVGNVYNDPNATTSGLGGTDNLCTGAAVPISDTDGTVRISRSGESKAEVLTSSSYTITANTANDDYTLILDLPVGVEDGWQCACNANPTDPYQCVYTNQQPNSETINFFIKPAGAEGGWFQTLGGSSWAEINIESNIPAATCTPPTCSPALIATDPAGTVDSAGFPLTNLGSVVTGESGETYIHEVGSRSNAVQAKGLGVDVPTENYHYFYTKVGGQAEALSTAAKPAAGAGLHVYSYEGDLIITENDGWNVPSDEQIVVLVSGSLTIDDTAAGENRITTVADDGGFLMFVVNNDLNVTTDVGYSNINTDPALPNIASVEGVFVADGVLAIEGQANTTDRKFIGAGTFVGWSGVDLQRNFDDGDSPELNNDTAAEVFIFRPDLLYNSPQILKSAQMTWREVNPSF